MVTSKPFATISYNTEVFLYNTLKELMRLREIEFFAFLEHLPEDDETKKHRHLFIVPSHRIDTCALAEKFQEPDPTHPKNPLGVIRFVSSKFADWYLYAIHDPDYLATKCECRKYSYQKDDITVSCPDYFNELIHTSDMVKYKQFAKFRDMVKSGLSFTDLFQKGFIPVQQIRQYEMAYYTLKNQYDKVAFTFRGDHKGHESTNAPTAEDWERFNDFVKMQESIRQADSTIYNKRRGD